MTKESIITRLKQDRDWNHYHNDSPGWNDACLLYNAQYGLSGREALRLCCTQSYTTLKEWLEIKK